MFIERETLVNDPKHWCHYCAKPCSIKDMILNDNGWFCSEHCALSCQAMKLVFNVGPDFDLEDD